MAAHLPPPKSAATLRQERDALAIAVKRREQEEQFQKESHQQQVLQQNTDYLNQFAADKPYWQLIEADVARHMPVIWEEYPNADPRAVLQEAHDRAVWSNPRTRSILQKAQADAESNATREAAAKKAEADAKKAEDAKKRAASAKRISALNASGTDQAPPDMEPDLRTAQRRLLAEMGIN
jgi:hypothetical protein